jgi:membrane protease YdiL (CAAX protease family)
LTFLHSIKPKKVLLAELLLAGLLLGYGWFSTYRLILLLVLASYSLWVRGLGWTNLGLTRPSPVSRVVLQAILGAGTILVAVRLLIVPLATWITGMPVDFSTVESVQGDPLGLTVWIAQAWTLAAIGEELVFRGYLIRRLADLVGNSRVGLTIGLVISSVFFGWAHRYLGPAGMIATGGMGALLAVLYLCQGNLWTVVMCHALVDTTALVAVYCGYRSLLFP